MEITCGTDKSWLGNGHCPRRFVRTGFALTRAPIRSRQVCDVSLGVWSARLALTLAGPFLVEISDAIAVDTRELPRLAREIPCCTRTAPRLIDAMGTGTNEAVVSSRHG